MAETIEHRIGRLLKKGIHIVSIEGNPQDTLHQAFCQLGVQVLNKNAHTGGIKYQIELLGYFANRGAEYVAAEINNCGPAIPFRNSAFGLALELGLSVSSSNSLLTETHLIEDPKYNRTHYFVMPSREYLE